ncbi:hypothetical protein C1J03_12230 [Sulfitobacter sp. SK012]|uniref:DUF6880 family protein n=1 Tax=Sulfitobacter sp. SK012 TaxID=1389005 RepID=UPI000E0B4098|nr:DUF6880 family protein [Sulfitobacter sp. SK012]AXI46720.1 hypothetical protein C1J03_12230 [Sulfitobacter sp. SK012]
MSKKTLNTTNLEALGAAQLAALLMEVSSGSADIKRRLRLELSHSLGPSELAHDVRKRLASISKSTSFVGWRRRKGLIKDLNTQVAMIVDKIAPADPSIAFDLLWQFIEIAPAVYDRVDDSKGDVGGVFRAAFAQFGTIAPSALVDPKALADRVWTALNDNGYGQWNGIIGVMAPALGKAGLALLKAHVLEHAARPLDAPAEDHEAIQFLRQLRGGNSYAADRKEKFVKRCLQEIAAIQGDTDAYIAQYSANDIAHPDIAAEVALLLLADDRAENGLNILLDADQDTDRSGQEAWDVAYISCLTALGRDGEAQAHRWECFAETLDTQHLRDYLKLLPDFEDVEAEDRARNYAFAFPRFSAALNFCVNWPDLLTAVRLVETRTIEINGDQYALLTVAAEALRARHPRAAVLLWRAMIDDTLGQSRSSRYGHAAEHLADCAALDAQIETYGTYLDHDHYLQNLQAQHERKASFWAKVR